MSTSYTRSSSFKDWMKKKFTRCELRDMANPGVSGGFNGLIYYRETTALYQKYHKDIWEMLYEDAENMGHKHPLEMIATFGGAGNVSDRDTFENLLVWYAAERVAYQLTEAEDDSSS